MDDPLREFLHSLLFEGRARLRLARGPDPGVSPAAVALLERAHRLRSLEIAGPPIPFDGPTATVAAVLARKACLALVDRGERPEDLAVALAMPLIPKTPAHHLAADLTFRFLPVVLRRARGADPTDPLVAILAKLLRNWPLSGVLAETDGPPSVPLDFSGHVGLMALYAERLVPRERAGWYPEGVAAEYVELARRAPSRGPAPHDVRRRAR